MLTLRLPHLRSRRTARLLCGALAWLLVASNTLAAMGICIAKVPAAVATTAASTAADAPCPQHAGDSQPTIPSAAHCPQDDPGVQARGADLPAVHLDALPAFSAALTLRRVPAESSAATPSHIPTEPLYARLSRLLL
jgi:hypothetical protein